MTQTWAHVGFHRPGHSPYVTLSSKILNQDVPWSIQGGLTASTVTATNVKTSSNSLRLLVRRWVRIQNPQPAKKKRFHLTNTGISQHIDVRRQTCIFSFCFILSEFLFILLHANLLRSPLWKLHWFQVQGVSNSRFFFTLEMTSGTKVISKCGQCKKITTL